MLNRQAIVYSVWLALVLAMLPAVTTAAGVGEIVVLKGQATRQALGSARVRVKRGDSVFEDDTIETKDGSFAMIRFSDKTRFNLGPKTTFKINQVRGGSDSVFDAEIVRGAFRFVTGLIAKQRSRAMRVKTGSVATIGIRGTTVGGEVDGDSATIVLLESEQPSTPSAIEVGNAHGQVEITQPGFGTRVPDAHSPPTPPERMSLRTIENLVRNINNIQRITVPRPSFR